MNGYERITAALRGERPDRVPVMLHNFMMAAREAGVTMKAFREDPRRMADVFIRAVEIYGYDGVLVDLDTATLAGALGVPVELPEDEPALCHGARLASLAEVDDLEPPDVTRDARVAVWLEAVRLLVGHFGREVYVRGNCDQAPFSLASMMRGAADWMMDLMDEGNRERAERLLDHCAEAGLQFVRLMAATGAHMVSSGDSPAGPDLVSPRIYREFALPWEKRLADEAHRLGLPVRAPHLRPHRPHPRGHAGDGRGRPGAGLQDRRAPRPRPPEGPGRLHRQPRPERRARPRDARPRRGEDARAARRLRRHAALHPERGLRDPGHDPGGEPARDDPGGADDGLTGAVRTAPVPLSVQPEHVEGAPAGALRVSCLTSRHWPFYKRSGRPPSKAVLPTARPDPRSPMRARFLPCRSSCHLLYRAALDPPPSPRSS